MVEISASMVKELREKSGAAMMDCKRALVEAAGDFEKAFEWLRQKGIAVASKKSSRVASEGLVVGQVSADGKVGVLIEVNCETDFVAREPSFAAFAAAVARQVLGSRPASLAALLELRLADGQSIDAHRRTLVAKLGENISIRRIAVLESPAWLGAYRHGSRIGVLVGLKDGDAELAHDLAMHVAASNPRYLSTADVPADELAKEREILTAQAQAEGKSPEIAAKMVEGRLRKSLGQMTLLGQPFVKDPEQVVEKLLTTKGAKVLGFERFEVGAGIEKKAEDFVSAVMAQVNAAGTKK